MSVPLTSKIIIKDWIDYNGHMNLSYYILVFDMGAEVILSKFQMGEQAAKTTKRSTMVVETHTNYIKEVKESDEVIISLSHVDHDKKRIHYRLSMFHKDKKYLAATNEVLSLYVDLNKRKVVEFDTDRSILMNNFIKKNSFIGLIFLITLLKSLLALVIFLVKLQVFSIKNSATTRSKFALIFQFKSILLSFKMTFKQILFSIDKISLELNRTALFLMKMVIRNLG